MLQRLDIDTPRVRQHLMDKLKGAVDVTDCRVIIAALQHIATGDFGYCTDCRSPIPVEILEQFPTATHCPDCVTRVLIQR